MGKMNESKRKSATKTKEKKNRFRNLKKIISFMRFGFCTLFAYTRNGLTFNVTVVWISSPFFMLPLTVSPKYFSSLGCLFFFVSSKIHFIVLMLQHSTSRMNSISVFFFRFGSFFLRYVISSAKKKSLWPGIFVRDSFVDLLSNLQRFA